jgi:hypothetical protein
MLHRAVAVIASVVVLSGAAQAGGPRWTEFGATKAAWNSAHTPDPDPKLVKGCCFLPRVRGGLDQFYEVLYDKFGGVERVYGFSMRFNPSVSYSYAQAVVAREASPASRLVFSIKKGDCAQIQYASPLLTRAFHDKSAAMTASLYSSDSGPFTGRVTDIIFLNLPFKDRTVGC